MSNKSIGLTDQVYDYLLRNSLREPAILRELREETAADPLANMQIAPEQGQFMALLVSLLGARNILEIGVFTGYSSLVMALAMPTDGRIIACDLSDAWTSVARRFWDRAGVGDRITLRLGPAMDTLNRLIATGESGQFDLAFIDADKTGYDGYYERCLELLRPGGLILIDNVLWGGQVADPENTEPDTVAIRALNAKIQCDSRVTSCLLPLADGLTLAMKQ
jgi:caffeoyl-CoA O-methyltransferase